MCYASIERGDFRLQFQLFSVHAHISNYTVKRVHKCNPYFDQFSIPDLKKESILNKLDQFSEFQVTRRDKNAKSACSCRIAASHMHL